MTPSAWLKAATVGPPLLISMLLGIVFSALLPPLVQLSLLAAHVALAGILATGRLEGTMVRLVWGGRPPTPGEAPTLNRILTLVERHLADSGLTVLVGRGRDLWVGPVGRRHVLLSPQVVHAHRSGRLPDLELVALIAAAAGRLRHSRTSYDLAFAMWSWPWLLIVAVAQAVGRRMAWIPLVLVVWKARIVVGVSAVVLEATEGRPGSAVICGLFIALSYLTSWWASRWEAQLLLAADRFVTRQGLGEPLARHLLRHASDPATLDRADRLRGPAPPPLAVLASATPVVPHPPAVRAASMPRITRRPPASPGCRVGHRSRNALTTSGAGHPAGLCRAARCLPRRSGGATTPSRRGGQPTPGGDESTVVRQRG